MTLTRKGYRPRLVDSQVNSMLKAVGAVCIEGPKWCGKTWVALNHSESAIMIGDPTGGYRNRALVKAEPKYAFKGNTPHLIDEWQEIPELWDATKFFVDERNELGCFILTGSSTPVIKGIMHSGAGRIGSVRMTTMSLFESGDSDGSVTLRSLFDSSFKNGEIVNIDLERLIHLTIRGGWPKNIGMDAGASLKAVKSYVKTIMDDAFRVNREIYDEKRMGMFMKSLARNESTLASVKTTISDMVEFDDDEEKTSNPISYLTAKRYRDILSRLFILNDQPAFSPNLRSSVRVGKSPKRHYVDPSIPIALMDLSADKLLYDLNTFGFFFEALCERDIGIYVNALGGKLLHYHDDSGREIDAIVELNDGRWGAFEIKISTYQIDEAAEKLIEIRDWMESKGIKRLPEFLCVICGTSLAAYRRPDGVYVVPITSLRN